MHSYDNVLVLLLTQVGSVGAPGACRGHDVALLLCFLCSCTLLCCKQCKARGVGEFTGPLSIAQPASQAVVYCRRGAVNCEGTGDELLPV